MVERHTDTRARIQEVALDLFTERGYEATSLREIAERVGVTKAALYYHFKTKDEILASFMEDRLAALEEIVAWGREQPRGLDSRREIVTRYAELFSSTGHHKLVRFMERNQTALHGNPKSDRARTVMRDLVNLLSEPDDPLPVRLRCSLAIFAMHVTWFVGDADAYGDEDRARAGLEVALELVEPVPAAQRERDDAISR